MNYFKMSELECPCGCGLFNMEPSFIALLNETRAKYGKAMRITSGCRCENHNNKIGGKPESWHLSGLAVDVAVNEPSARAKLIGAAFDLGWRGIGVAHTFVHLDMGTRPTRLVWLYK